MAKKTVSFPVGTAKYKDESAVNNRINEAVAAGAKVRVKISLPEPGDMVCGKLLGNGDKAEFVQPDGEVRAVDTWDLDISEDLSGGRIGNVTSSAQLDMRLPTLVGHVIEIIRAGSKKTRKGNQVTDYHVIDHGEVK